MERIRKLNVVKTRRAELPAANADADADAGSVTVRRVNLRPCRIPSAGTRSNVRPARVVNVVLSRVANRLIGDFGPLAQRQQEVGRPGRLIGVGRRFQDEEHPRPIGLFSLRAVP